MVGLLIASRLSRTEGEQLAGVWQMDDEDKEDIGRPLARIAARHAGIGNGPVGDTADAVAATVALAGYGLKNAELSRQVRADPYASSAPTARTEAAAQARDDAAAAPSDPSDPVPPPPTYGGLIPPPMRSGL